MPSASRTAESIVPSATGYQSAPGSTGASRSRRARPEPPLIAMASLPEAEIRWSARRPARSSMRAAPDVDDDRGRDEAGQYRHAISLPLARSSWLSISTQVTSPMGATSTVKPRFTSSW